MIFADIKAKRAEKKKWFHFQNNFINITVCLEGYELKMHWPLTKQKCNSHKKDVFPYIVRNDYIHVFKIWKVFLYRTITHCCALITRILHIHCENIGVCHFCPVTDCFIEYLFIYYKLWYLYFIIKLTNNKMNKMLN